MVLHDVERVSELANTSKYPGADWPASCSIKHLDSMSSEPGAGQISLRASRSAWAMPRNCFSELRRFIPIFAVRKCPVFASQNIKRCSSNG